MDLYSWLSDNYIEIFGAVTGILYVFLEIRQNIWLWPVGIATSAVYIIVFFTNKFYADMSLQGYYLVISVLGWYWWVNGRGQRAESGRQGAQGRELRAQSSGRRAESGSDEKEKLPSLEIGATRRFRDSGSLLRNSGGSGVGNDEKERLFVSRLKTKTGIILSIIFVALYTGMWFVLDRFTDSPVPAWDSFITSLSIIATWMLARKIFEHWYLWIIVNAAAMILFITRGLYPTVILYLVYFAMSFAGLRAWRRSL